MEAIMRAVLQRVQRGAVSVENRQVANIGQGLVILLGIGPEDTKEIADAMVKKIAMMRIFGDENGKMNLSVLDIKGDVIVVSQFTLYANTKKGHRPSFNFSAQPEIAEPLVDYFAEEMRALGVPTQTGEFGAHMLVEIENDGPVTIILEM
jgi:D-tyrosyl-tRNA(Tyr) deacylase